MSLGDLRRAWPQWQIQHKPDEMNGGAVYVGHPKAEEIQPPVFEQPQMVRGLRNRVVEKDLGEFERQIGLQDKLRRQMADAGERPFDGTTYVEAERARVETSDA